MTIDTGQLELPADTVTGLWGDLDRQGYAVTPPLLDPAECAELVAAYDRPEPWRSRVDMARHRFGDGEYKYFDYPLPDPVTRLRTAFYPVLAPIANAWQECLRLPERFPGDLDGFLGRCHDAGQTRATPLVLRYGAGGYNCLHQDIYGEHAFPLQLMVMLSPRAEYDGGEFLLVEQIPRAQSRGTAITLEQGQGVIWPTRYRPGRGARGFYRIAVRHGVSTVRSGRRHTLGVIFHDAA
jgi:hypothetical protein